MNTEDDGGITMRSEQEWRNYVANQLREGEKRMDRIETNTKEIIDLFETLKGGARILVALGGLAKWVASLAVAGTIFWAIIQWTVQHTKPPGP